MNRQGHENVNFFIGTEVEHTPAYGKPTLFVVGRHSMDDIAKALASSNVKIEHIFFGANHSFDPKDHDEWTAWEGMIMAFLNLGYLCSLDIPITAAAEFNDGGLCEFHNFIPQIRISIPYLRLWNYNTMIKIDDQDFDATNPGVWCHSLHSLMDRRCFTPWHDYSNDSVI
jgi:hypothetical protein